MTQLFIGLKPGVGPVVKVLKYNGDDALTLANDAFDRYYFNSESQDLSFVFGTFRIDSNWSTWRGTVGTQDFQGNTQTAQYSAYVYRANATSKGVNTFARLDNISGQSSYPVIPEIRWKHPDTGRILAARREISYQRDEINYEQGVVTHYQFPYNLKRVTSHGGSDYLPWQTSVPSALSYIPLGSWVATFDTNMRGYNGNQAGTQSASDNGKTTSYLFNYWDLPANSAPMPSYTSASNLETIRLSGTQFVVTRPGFSVDGSAGRRQRIIDSNGSPALCVMAGETPSIAAGGSLTIPGPPGIILSEEAVVDMLFRETGRPQFIPPFREIGYVRNTFFGLWYTVQSNSVTFYNEGSDAITVRYVVFNTDRSGTSSGGNLVMFTGHDGTREFIQIKKPGTSDPASRPNDILLDTRFPSLQIIKEDFIPIESFSSAIAENTSIYGKVAHEVTFDNNGFLPFVKFTTVFPNHILPPVMSMDYSYIGGIPIWRDPSNQSSLCRLENTKAKFWLSPGNWSRKEWNSDKSRIDFHYDGPNPRGIRYYIFGVATA